MGSETIASNAVWCGQKKVKGLSVKSVKRRYWLEDGREYDRERHDASLLLDVSYQNWLHRCRVITADLVDYDW